MTVALLAAVPAAATPVRIVGSDLLGLEFSKALYGLAGREGIRLALAFDGTKAGVAELQAGRAAAALLVAAPEIRPVLATHEVRPVANAVVFIWAGAACPLRSATYEQLALIFGAGSAPHTVRWRDLGIAGEAGDTVVSAQAPEAGAGLALDLFRHAVLRGGALRKSVERFQLPEEAGRALAGADSGVVLAGGPPPERSGIRVLPVIATKGGRAIAPAAEAVRSGEYALQVPLELVIRADAPAEVRRLLRFVYSDEAAVVLAAAEFLPLAAEERRRQAATLDPK